MSTLINYPGLVPNSIRWTFDRGAGVMRSPRGGTIQRFDTLAAKWILHFDLPPLQGADADAMGIFLRRAASPSVWFQAPDYSYHRRSVPNGTPKVDGAGQEGAEIDLKGFTPGFVDAVKMGDRIGLKTGQVVVVTEDEDADGAGKLTAKIDPPLRASPADNDDVYIDLPLAVFFLPASRADGLATPGDLHAFAFDCEEDIGTSAPDVNYGSWS